LVQQHAASFIAHAEASTGSELLRFIKDEFDAFLECEILAYGSLRPRCGGCGHDKLLAFSCKRWGSALRAERVGCGRQPPIWSTSLLLALSRKAPPAGTFAVMRRVTDLGVAAAPGTSL
jgi:hypothetical protein